jgi:hypothetical protein
MHVLKMLIVVTHLCLAMAGLHHHPVHHRHVHHSVVAVQTVNYALYPCAAGHPPVNPDAGACQGTLFIAS